MRHALWLGFHSQLDYVGSLGRRNRSNTPRTRFILDDSSQALLSIPLAPPAHFAWILRKAFSNFLVLQAICGLQNHL